MKKSVNNPFESNIYSSEEVFNAIEYHKNAVYELTDIIKYLCRIYIKFKPNSVKATYLASVTDIKNISIQDNSVLLTIEHETLAMEGYEPSIRLKFHQEPRKRRYDIILEVSRNMIDEFYNNEPHKNIAIALTKAENDYSNIHDFLALRKEVKVLEKELKEKQKKLEIAQKILEEYELNLDSKTVVTEFRQLKNNMKEKQEELTKTYYEDILKTSFL